MARNVVYRFFRIGCKPPDSRVVVDTPNYSSFDLGILSRRRHQKSLHLCVENTPSQSIPEIVVENSNVCSFLIAFSESNGSSPSSPRLSIYYDRWIHGMELTFYCKNCFSVHQSHLIQSKTIYMVLLNPVFQSIEDEFSHHGSFTCYRVPTTTFIQKRSIFVYSVEVIGNGLIEGRKLSDTERVWKDHIHDHTYTFSMKSQYHLFEFFYSDIWIFRICRISSFWNHVKNRIVSPVVTLLEVFFLLVARIEIEDR